jgi:hypothetical protein
MSLLSGRLEALATNEIGSGEAQEPKSLWSYPFPAFFSLLPWPLDIRSSHLANCQHTRLGYYRHPVAQ